MMSSLRIGWCPLRHAIVFVHGEFLDNQMVSSPSCPCVSYRPRLLNYLEQREGFACIMSVTPTLDMSIKSVSQGGQSVPILGVRLIVIFEKVYTHRVRKGTIALY